MQIVEALGDVTVHGSAGQVVYRLEAGQRYALHDFEAANGERDGVLEHVGPLDRLIPRWTSANTGKADLLVPFTGGMGDALVAAACLQAFVEAEPERTAAVSAVDTIRALLGQATLTAGLLPYPLRIESLAGYSHYATLEYVARAPRATRRSLGDVFAATLGTPRPSRCIPLQSKLHAAERWLPGREAGIRLIGIHLKGHESLKTYPSSRCLELARVLIQRGYAVVLLGTRAEAPGDWPHSPPRVWNHVGQTESPAELVSLLSCLDGLIGPDSLLVHIAASLKIPTVAMFTSTSSTIVGDYRNVAAARSVFPCSPCDRAAGACPLGQPHCAAGFDAALAPEVLADMLEHALENTTAAAAERAMSVGSKAAAPASVRG